MSKITPIASLNLPRVDDDLDPEAILRRIALDRGATARDRILALDRLSELAERQPLSRSTDLIEADRSIDDLTAELDVEIALQLRRITDDQQVAAAFPETSSELLRVAPKLAKPTHPRTQRSAR